MRLPAEGRVQQHHALGLRLDDPDLDRACAERVLVQEGEGVVRGLLRDDRDELPLVRHVQRVDAEDLAGREHRGLHRQRGLAQAHGELGLGDELVQRGREAAARRVAHPAQRAAEAE